MAKYPCKIVIVGGSVAGLALANMLEQVGIDFVVLEAWKDIAPQVGASIAIQPPMARVLDQIGLWLRSQHESPVRFGDSLCALVDKTVNHTFCRDPTGKVVFEFRGLADGLERRHGYPIIFIERQMLLQKLYEKLQQKEKVLVSKRFVGFEQDDTGVRVMTEDGSCYEGDILVGADGMHSSVRKQMHRLAHIESPGYFDKDEYSKVPCTYKCIFGISPSTKGIPMGTNQIIMGKNYSYVVFTGPGSIYWFLNVKNPRVTHGKEVPRYTVEDELRLAEEHFGDQLNDHDTFGDVYKSKRISRLTPLHEYQWKRWHFKRVTTIGDAAHKVHPISGSGGGAAVEDGAVLVNALLRKLDLSKRKLSSKDIQDIFAHAQNAQEERTQGVLTRGTMLQQSDAMESPLAPLIVKYLVPHITDDAALAIVGVNAAGGQRIESIPMPNRYRYVPYDDELPAKPLKSASVVNLGFALAQILLFYLASLPAGRSEFLNAFPSNATAGPYADTVLKYLLPEDGESVDKPLLLQQQPSLLSYLPIMLIWNLEGYRRGNKGSLWAWPIAIPFIVAFTFKAPARLLPLYFFLSVVNSSRSIYTATIGRPVSASVAKAMIGVTCTVYAASAILLLAGSETTYGQGLEVESIWRLLPAGIPLLTTILHTLHGKYASEDQPVDERAYMIDYYNQDYRPLAIWYRILLAASVLGHLVTPAPVLGQQHLVTTAIVLHCLQSAFQLRSLGYITALHAAVSMLAAILGTAVVGPAAAYVGIWYWREHVICKLTK